MDKIISYFYISYSWLNCKVASSFYFEKIGKISILKCKISILQK